MRFFEVDSAVDAIMSAAMVAQGRASQQGKVGRLSMNGFLQMLANAGIVMDYEGFKTVFDTNPQIKNVVGKFDKDSITFVGDADDESDGYEEPNTDMPDDERVAKMAKKAMRTREFVESVKEDVAKKLSDDDKKVLSIVVDRIKMLQKEMEKSKQGGYDEDVRMIKLQLKDHYDIAKLIQGQGDGFGLDTAVMDIVYDLYDKVGGKFEAVGDDQLIKPMVNMKGATLKRYGKNLAKKYPHLAPTVKSMMPTEEIETEAELPAHLGKMFGKDGTQVDTRTDVMKQMRDIVDNKSAMNVTFGDGKQMVDMYTASVLVQIYDKVSSENKEKIVQRVGTIEKFTKLMPKLFGMIGEGSSPHPKGSKKYKAHMAAKHANMNEGKSMEDKIAADIEAGMSTDAIIGKYANKRTTNTGEIRKIIQKIKFKMFKNEGIRKGRPATGKDKISDPAEESLKKRIAKHIEDGLTRREVVAAYPNRDPNDIAKLYDEEKALQDFEAGAKEMFPKAKDEPPTKKLSLRGPMNMEPLDLSKVDPNRITVRSMRKK